MMAQREFVIFVHLTAACMFVQVEQPTGLPGVWHAVVGRPLAGPMEHPASWVHYEDGADKKFIQRNGSLFQNNKGEDGASMGGDRSSRCSKSTPFCYRAGSQLQTPATHKGPC